MSLAHDQATELHIGGWCAMSLAKRHRTVSAPLLLAMLLMAAACGAPTQQAKECSAGGSADDAVFAQHFSQMEFGSGSASTGEGGQEFASSEAVVVVAAAKGETATRFCAQERGRLSTVVYDQTHSLSNGESRTSLGVFEKKGDYVIRVSVGQTLVRNFTFTVR